MKNLRGIIVGEHDPADTDPGPLFTSASLVIDESLPDSEGKGIAFVFYSPGGNIIMLRDGYDPTQVMVAGEKYIGQTVQTTRYQFWKAQKVPPS
jgi:hypothetical protein